MNHKSSNAQVELEKKVILSRQKLRNSQKQFLQQQKLMLDQQLQTRPKQSTREELKLARKQHAECIMLGEQLKILQKLVSTLLHVKQPNPVEITSTSESDSSSHYTDTSTDDEILYEPIPLQSYHETESNSMPILTESVTHQTTPLGETNKIIA